MSRPSELGFLFMLGACSPARPEPLVAPALAHAAGCYEVSTRFWPPSLARLLPDSLDLALEPVMPSPSGSVPTFKVRTTPAYRQRYSWQLTWSANGDSLWIYRNGSEDGQEYRLARTGPDWRGVVVAYIDVVVPDSQLPRWRVYLRRVACLGFT
jgi:hypothetical protein